MKVLIFHSLSLNHRAFYNTNFKSPSKAKNGQGQNKGQNGKCSLLVIRVVPTRTPGQIEGIGPDTGRPLRELVRSRRIRC